MTEVKDRYTNIHYKNYLQLDKLLSAQRLRSAELEAEPAHEEMLFIIVHQAYELWFKQIIHELESVLELFKQEKVHERNIGTAIGRLERVIDIQKILIDQIGIMETMTPLDFLDFRKYLFPASGFQSFQFRKIENLLGLETPQRITYNGCPYSSVFSKDKKEELEQLESDTSLFEAIEMWLERTPFLHTGDFDFVSEYRNAVSSMFKKEKEAILKSDYLSDEEKEMRVRNIANTEAYIYNFLDVNEYEKHKKEGEIRMSHKALVAALLINLYRDEPLLHLPFRLLTCIIEIDDQLTTWRYRHAQMVLRMLGNKMGTGGSTGHEYLNATAKKHIIYRDLHNISTLMIPRSELPELPHHLKQQLSFFFSNKS